MLAGRVTVSIGIAHGPEHAANPRELVACAESGDDDREGERQVRRSSSTATARPSARASSVDRREEDVRSIAHLKMLQSLGTS